MMGGRIPLYNPYIITRIYIYMYYTPKPKSLNLLRDLGSGQVFH